MADVPIACSCGQVRGVADVSQDSVNRLVCHCDDCQSFAHFLERADEILDEHGGSDICQMSPGRLRITQGAENLACVRLTEKGLVRWYASCCRTPLANTMLSQAIPFAGVLSSSLRPEGSLDRAIGPVRAGVFARFAKGDRATLIASERPPLSMIFRFLKLALGARLRGDQKRSPFFGSDGKPVAEPRVLSADELRSVETARDAT
jgi:hypothetical protein